MKIQFDKIGQSEKHFSIVENNISFEGILQKKNEHMVKLLGSIEGNLELLCNRCGCSMELPSQIALELTLSDEIVTDDKVDLDIIEFLDSQIDLSYILESELNSIMSEYHYCDKCQSSNEALELEF